MSRATGHNSQRARNGYVGECPTCGKRRYLTRREARKRIRDGFPGQHMAAYRCGDYFHIGHLPSRLVAGDISRDQIPRKDVS